MAKKKWSDSRKVVSTVKCTLLEEEDHDDELGEAYMGGYYSMSIPGAVDMKKLQSQLGAPTDLWVDDYCLNENTGTLTIEFIAQGTKPYSKERKAKAKEEASKEKELILKARKEEDERAIKDLAKKLGYKLVSDPGVRTPGGGGARTKKK